VEKKEAAHAGWLWWLINAVYIGIILAFIIFEMVK